MKNPNPAIRTCLHDSNQISVLRATPTSSDPALWEFTLRCRSCGARFTGYLANIDQPEEPSAAISFRSLFRPPVIVSTDPWPPVKDLEKFFNKS